VRGPDDAVVRGVFQRQAIDLQQRSVGCGGLRDRCDTDIEAPLSRRFGAAQQGVRGGRHAQFAAAFCASSKK
jgi:hypothetical protein